MCACCLLWFSAVTSNQSDILHLCDQVEKLWLPLEGLTYNVEQWPFSFAGVPLTSSFPRDLLMGMSSGGFILQIYSNMPVSPEPVNVFINKPRDIRYSPLIHRRPFFIKVMFFIHTSTNQSNKQLRSFETVWSETKPRISCWWIHIVTASCSLLTLFPTLKPHPHKYSPDICFCELENWVSS